jgi:hypothetical protein
MTTPPTTGASGAVVQALLRLPHTRSLSLTPPPWAGPSARPSTASPASFSNLWERDIERLRSAVVAADGAAAERTAHSFRSSLACFAAEPAVAMAADLESRARHGWLAGMETEIAALEREIRTLAGHLRLVAPVDSG